MRAPCSCWHRLWRAPPVGGGQHAAVGAVEEVEGDDDQGIDGRWRLLGLLGLFGYRDRDRYVTTTTTRRPWSTQSAVVHHPLDAPRQ